MAVADLTSSNSITTGNDSIVIIKNLGDIPGGRTLDVTGFTPDVIKAGHLIIRDTVGGEYKPNPISGTDFAALPANHEYVGVLVSSIQKSRPFAAIMDRGDVLEPAMPYGSVPAGAKTALNLIKFKTAQ